MAACCCSSLLACVVGAGAGAIGTLFRIFLEHADAWRDALIGWAHGAPIVGFVLVTSWLRGRRRARGLAWFAATRRKRRAAEFRTSRRCCARTCRRRRSSCCRSSSSAGLSAIGSGLALGREGPSVQMGAIVAHIAGKLERPQMAGRQSADRGRRGCAASRPRSTRPPRVRYSCWRNWCGGSNPAWRSPRSAASTVRSSCRACCTATP